MPISLPNSPTNGQTVQIGTVVYTYDATAGVWNSEFESGVSSIVHTSDTAPLNPTDGDIWFDSSIGKTFIWYNDGTSSQWIQMNPNTGGSGGANLGSVSESIIPDTDITYDLGSSSKKFKDLYLSGSTLNLGNQSISATATGIVVPEIQIGSGTNNVKLTTNASGNLITTETDSSGNSGAASPAGGAAAIVADMAGLIALTGMAAGSQAYVSANNRLYFYTGSGWYLIATVQNDAPSAITGVDGSYTLALDGTATTITAISTDPEGFALTWSYTASGLGSIATVSRADNVFTVTPSTDAANAGSFTLTISATDGINGAVSTIPSFSLQFSVINSRYTALSVKATNTGNNTTFDDASTSNHTITVDAGDPTSSTFSPYRAGGYSASFDSNGDYLQTTLSENIGTSQFTIECWVRMPAPGGPHGVFHLSTSAFPGNLSGLAIFTRSSTYSYNWGFFNDGTQVNSSTAPSSGVWHHLALVRDSNNLITMYLDGNSLITATQTGSIAGDILTIGGYYSSSYIWNGDIRDFRIIKGTAVYASNFTPPTTPLTAITNTKFLLGQLPYFKDQSASNHAIAVNGDTTLKPKSLFDNAPYSEADHGASAYFDGDRLSVADNSAFDVGSGDFTAECWVYPTGSPNQPVIFGQWTSPYSWAILLSNDANRYARMIFYDGGYVDQISSTVVPLNQWSHMALVKDGSNATLYVNGNSVATQGSIGTLTDTNVPLTIGGNSSTAGFIGYIADARFVVGSKLYTSNFTPPAAALTAVTNTKFLFNPETSISDLSQSSKITCVADVATDTTQVKFAGTKSIAFDGTGDYLTFDIDGDIGANEDFTVELWHRFSSDQWGGLFQVAPQILGNAHGSSIPTFAISRRTSGGRYQMYSGAGGYISAGAGQTTVGQWYHLAYVRYNGTIKIYEDGTEITALSAADTTVYTNPKGVIGGKYATGYLMFGNIQDFRFTRGLARYTANFTPPTTELEG